MRIRVGFIVLGLSLVSICLISMTANAISTDSEKTISANLNSLQSSPAVIGNIKAPNIQNPDWLQRQLDAEAAAARAAAEAKAVAAARAALVPESPVSRTIDGTVTYDVSTDGSIVADLAEFKALANETLNDSRGWSRLGVNFQEVASGGSFTLVLSEASHVPNYSYVCSSDWSCRVGRYVIINQDRWLYASDSWNNSGGSLRDYRNMVINHETGHWLGHSDDNAHCGGSGQSAPVMQQQSISLLGCSFNPWPLNFEMWSSQLGIY